MTSYSDSIKQIVDNLSQIFETLQPMQTDVIEAAYNAQRAGEKEIQLNYQNLEFCLDTARKNLVIAETMIYRTQLALDNI